MATKKTAVNKDELKALSDKAARVLKYLLSHPNQKFTYGELAKKLDSSPMAIGQIMKSIAFQLPKYKGLTKRVKANEAA